MGKTWLEIGHKLTDLMKSAEARHQKELAKLQAEIDKTMLFKQLLIGLVKHFEGYEPVPKPDPLGIPTVGYGHVVVGGEPPYPWTEEIAAQYLCDELMTEYLPLTINAWTAETDRQWRKEAWADLPAHAQAAIVSAVYNAGPSIIETGSWIHKKTDSEAGQLFYKWSTGKNIHTGKRERLAGLVRRRFSEWHLATTGEVDADVLGWHNWYESHLI